MRGARADSEPKTEARIHDEAEGLMIPERPGSLERDAEADAVSEREPDTEHSG
jgi:hypothetical protein